MLTVVPDHRITFEQVGPVLIIVLCSFLELHYSISHSSSCIPYDVQFFMLAVVPDQRSTLKQVGLLQIRILRHSLVDATIAHRQ